MASSGNEIVCTTKSGTPITFTVKHKGNASPPVEAASTTAASPATVASTTAASSNGSALVAPVVVNAAKAAAKTAANDPTKAAAKVAAAEAAAKIVTETEGIAAAAKTNRYRDALISGRRINEALVEFNEALRILNPLAKPVGELVGVKPYATGKETQQNIDQLGTRAKDIAQTIAEYVRQVESMGGGRRKTHHKKHGKRSKTHKKHSKRSRKHRRM